MSQCILSDMELQQLLVENDYFAFTALYNRYSKAIHAFVLNILKSSELTEDATQEVFSKIWTNRAHMHEVRVFKAYLYTVARNHALKTLKLAFRNEASTNHIINSFVACRNVTEDDMLSKEYLSFIKRTLDTLPDRSKEIFLLCREEGKSYQEVAEKLGISSNAVKNHMVHSMKVFRRLSEKELGISLSILLSVLTGTIK